MTTVAALLVTYRRVRLTEFLPSELRHFDRPAGRAAEFGTLKRPATPSLADCKARLPAIKARLTKLALAAAMIP